MNFAKREKVRLIEQREFLFRDPGLGVFSGQPREFVLSEASANLWPGIREDALSYFRDNKISWWRGADGEPTGHLLSSQIACINHLFALRQRADLATAILRALDPAVLAAERVDDGYVEFEFIGSEPRLQERAFTRGANCTSVDAMMIGRIADGSRRAFLIEWKYTESYPSQDKYIPQRSKVYDHLITADDSPFKLQDPRVFYYEPFYQLMRQTLLGWLMSKNGDYGCRSYRNVHVVPEQNLKLHNGITSPTLIGTNLGDVWKSMLRQPELYIGRTPETFTDPIAAERDTKTLLSYLHRRYWAAV